ncbi:MAG: T9SS type A sorting domain-containing protein [Bacteroidales bacterium]|nr:T9SS type A sorting domain-containing protein [Bacteroidales bacterium]
MRNVALLIVAIAVLAPCRIDAQELIKIGNSTFMLNDIKKVLFQNDDLSIELINGSKFFSPFLTVYFVNPTAAENAKMLEPLVSFFPNPVKDVLRVESSVPIEFICIYDLQGRLIKHIETTDLQLSIDFSTTGKGIYFVKTKYKIAKIIKN